METLFPTRHVYFTSFFKVGELPGGVRPFSAAVYQPKGFTLPKVGWTDIRDVSGQWIRPRNFLSDPEPLLAYRTALLSLYEGRVREAESWVAGLEEDVALCCWCPHDRAAQRQLREFGSYVCHTAVLAEFLRDRFGVPTWEDAERREMAVLTQR